MSTLDYLQDAGYRHGKLIEWMKCKHGEFEKCWVASVCPIKVYRSIRCKKCKCEAEALTELSMVIP